MANKLEIGDVAKIVSNGDGVEVSSHHFPLGTLVTVEREWVDGSAYWCVGVVDGSQFPQIINKDQLELVEEKEVL